jgi:molybdate transport system regulatory protein
MPTGHSRTQLILRLRFGQVEPQLGPGKIELMERIARDGSISAACRAMRMSYHRAWTIVNEINAMFRDPLIETQLGGVKGGGATITPLGRDVVRRYRSIERSVWRHAAGHIAALEACVGAPLEAAGHAANRKAQS